MDTRNFTTHLVSRQPDTYLSSRTTAPTHRCYFGGSNKCACGKHREPMTVSGIGPQATAREHLAVEL